MARATLPGVDWSPRERQVLGLIAKGKTNGQIAEALGISFATAKWHVSELISKVGVESREEVAAYWKGHESAAARLRRTATRLAAAPVLIKAAAAVTGAALVAGAVVGVIALVRGDDDEAPSQPAVTATAVPSLEPSPTGTPPAVSATPTNLAGFRVLELERKPDGPLPPDWTFYVFGVFYQTDAGLQRLVRNHVSADGTVHTLDLWEPLRAYTADRRPPYTFAASDDMTLMYAAVCPSSCGVGVLRIAAGGDVAVASRQPPPSDGQLFRSIDGGVTWQDIGTISGGTRLAGVVGTQALASKPVTRDGKPGAEFFLLPSDQRVEPPPGSYSPRNVSGLGVAWLADDGQGAALELDGTELFGGIPGAARAHLVAIDKAGRRYAVTGFTTDTPYGYLFVDYGNNAELYDLQGGYLFDAVLFEPGSLMGAIWKETADGLNLELGMVDVKGLTTQAIPDLEAGLQGRERGSMAGAVRGPFVMVTGTGDCLNVRVSAATSSASLGCFGDGVLLKDLDETATGDGRIWRKVATPSGEPGWAADEFLER